MNKTVIFVTFAILVMLAIIGSVVLLIVRPDASATFISQVVVLLGLVVTAAGTFYGFGKVQEKVDEIGRQTNGTLSRKDEELDYLRTIVAEHNIAIARKETPQP